MVGQLPLHPTPYIFYGVEIGGVGRPFENLHSRCRQELLCCSGGMGGCIVQLEDKVVLKQDFHGGQEVFLQNSHISLCINGSIHNAERSGALEGYPSPHHNFRSKFAPTKAWDCPTPGQQSLDVGLRLESRFV